MQELNPTDYLVGNPPKNYKDEAKITAWSLAKHEELEQKYQADLIAQKDKQHELHHKQALNSMQGTIVCVCFAIGDAPVQSFTGDEVIVLDSLYGALKELKGSKYAEYDFIGHNIYFDLGFLYHKSIKHNSKLKTLLPKANDRNRIVDTNKEWNLGQYGKYTKLSAIAEFLGIEQKDEIDGSQVWEAYKAGRIDQIVEHCVSDVNVVREIEKRL
jgi:predicted PolB exonuclease-like 3'-5' exonuclease